MSHAPSLLTEKELLIQLKSGEQAAFDLLYH
jgi:RNA polymerase sigma-70 factor (family 1)